jgi:recombination protein RecA
MALARADLESLLRTRQLDRTLTTALPFRPETGPDVTASTGIASLDALVGGGLPRGQLSELVGPRSSGRTSLMLQMLASATARGEIVALVDALDMLDVESTSAAGVDLERLLWVRGHVVANPGLCRDLNQRALEQALRALALILQAGNFGLVLFDVAEAPTDAVRRLPFTTWLRLQRIIEGGQTTCVLVGSEAMARSTAGLSIRTGIRDWRLEVGDSGFGIREGGVREEGGIRDGGSGIRFRDRLFDGLNIHARVVRARTRNNEEASVALSTVATYCA